MSGTLGIVEVHHVAGGLPERRLGGKSVLEWVVRRATDAQLIDQVIVLCGSAAAHSLIDRLVPSDVHAFVAEGKDALARFASAMRHFDAREAVRIRVGSPFVDPVLIDQLVASVRSHGECDYASFCAADGRPRILAQLGIAAEWCAAEAIERADREARGPSERAEATRYLYSHPELFQLRLIPLPLLLDRHDVRLAVLKEEDWENAQEIYEALGPEALDWQRIAGLLDQQPALRERMAVLNRADAEH